MWADARIERIAFVTRRFADLQGLRGALLGILLVVAVLAASLSGLDSFNPFSQVNGVLGAWMAGNFMLLEAYYNRRFGRIPLVPGRIGLFHAVPAADDATSLEAEQRSGTLVRPEAWGPLVVMAALAVESIKSIYFPGGVSLVAFAVLSHSTWVVVRDWRFRSYHLVGVAAGVVGLSLTLATPMSAVLYTPLPPGVAAAYGQTYALIGLALIVAGLLDHRLLWQGMSRADAPLTDTPDRGMSVLRLVTSATCLTVLVAYIGIAGWPGEPQYLYMALLVAMTGVLIFSMRRRISRIRIEAEVAASARARLRAECLEAKVAGLRGEGRRVVADLPEVVPLPRFDTLGYLVLPIAMAGGALADVGLRGGGYPSLLAFALAASHLRIAWRDWPHRGSYVLGTVAASISAVHFAIVPAERPLDWVVTFLLLMSAASLVEGLFDLRLSRTRGPVQGDDHAHTV